MGGLARMRRQEMDKFNLCWAKLYEKVPEAKAVAVKAMGEEAKKVLDAQIQSADLQPGAKGDVQTWQRLRLGREGGYAAVSPISATPPPNADRKRKSWKGRPVTTRMVTKWLERGHGTPTTGETVLSWNQSRKRYRHIKERTGMGFVPGRQFYSFTELYAFDLAKKAADRVLSAIADEVDF